MRFLFLIPLFATAAIAVPVTLVAPTDKLTPEQQRATFKLPPGFEAQLVAAEPDIAKPMNIAFDDRGRLWVTSTLEYPWPAEPGKGRDSVKILSDFGPDGRARKVTTFVEGLNIPLGVLPIGDGAIVYSIPEIRRYHDTDGDGKADKSEKLLGDFGTVDTHGMTNNFVRGFDGFIYANHGFRNDSNVTGTDGSTITMNSGNTYRFKPDGTKVQLFARGQVNPFGLAFDAWGNLFSADCHTRPQYLLLRGAVYPSFGKPDDGLGFGPEMCPHDHGSTGIAGTMVYAAEQFPPEYRGNLFNGNPVTNTINRDKLKWTGSTPLAIEQPDFLVSSDPWFRPVQVKLGPDGAMYIADFYNKIIGHYEVDLKHPGRDRTSGRIWRIVYKGDAKTAPPPAMPDMASASPDQLVKWLADPNLTVRMMATDRLADNGPAKAQQLVENAFRNSEDAQQRIHAMWVLARWGKLPPDGLAHAGQETDPGAQALTHLMRVLAEQKELTTDQRSQILGALQSKNAYVRRAAADAAAQHPGKDFIHLLINATPAEGDTHLAHAMKIALRQQLTATTHLADAIGRRLQPQVEARLFSAAIGVHTPAAGAFIADRLANGQGAGADIIPALRHATRLVADLEAIEKLVPVTRSVFDGDMDLQLDALTGIRAGLAARGIETPASVEAWAEALVTEIFNPPEDSRDATFAWKSEPADGGAAPFTDPWTPQSRKCADGKTGNFWSSLPRGEKLTGVLRSRPFAAPARLTFWIAGHNGLPSEKQPVRNTVRLIDVATGEVLADAPAARNDVAQQVVWDLAKVAGRQVAIEAVDADDRSAYAWIAFGRIGPRVVPVPSGGTDLRKRIVSAMELAGAMRLTIAAPKVREVLADANADASIRLSAANAIAAIDPAGAVEPIAAIVNDAATPLAVRQGCALALASVRDPSAIPALLTALTAAPQDLQRVLALAMSGTQQGADALVTAVAAGKASPRLLTDKTVVDKLRAAGVQNLDAQLAALTKGIPDVDAAVQKLIDDRRQGYASAAGQVSAERGKAVFVKNCAACHRIGNEGAQIGPQLDGLGKRGVERVIEDILDPSRNVDGAFRYSIVTLDDGDVVTGLQRRAEGESIVFADATGKEFSLPAKKIVRRSESQLSLMPANLGDVMSKEELNDLLAFLLER